MPDNVIDLHQPMPMSILVATLDEVTSRDTCAVVIIAGTKSGTLVRTFGASADVDAALSAASDERVRHLTEALWIALGPDRWVDVGVSCEAEHGTIVSEWHPDGTIRYSRK